jgi:molecular chaperone DnaJ/curved DNA-binding protein
MILPPEVALRGGVAFLNVPKCAPCRLCGGTGQERLWAGRLCDGEGITEEEETVSVRIPPQIGDGALFELPLPGMGVHNFYLRLQMRVGA